MPSRRILVAAPSLFDFSWMLEFLAPRAVPGVEEVDLAAGEYRRSVRFAGLRGAISVRLARGRPGRPDRKAGSAGRPRATGAGEDRGLLVCVAGGLDAAAAARAIVRMFDLEAPVAELVAALRADPCLRASLARRPGIRLPVYTDPFEGLVRAILGQQVSVAGARTIAGRLVRDFGEPAPGLGGRELRLFPGPAALAAVPPARLQAVGLTGAKTRAIHGAARAVAAGALDLVGLAAAAGSPAAAATSATSAALRALPGIGPWTAGYVAMRALGDRDAFPLGDLGVRKALALHHPSGRRPGPRELASVAERWRPWRAYATLHLWNSL
ncbi:MAG TPA: AlkA N-terminal domain-containing protein [Thermoanaerobaculia bacterium]|nr:AlkA N-terminal domain-containing protein [Thermoanaerobaculia bacterium]